jgi:hypothetical protein
MLDIQVILVPQGVEHRAVCRGLRQSLNPPTVFPIPVGQFAVLPYLDKLHQAGYLDAGQQVLVMGLCGALSPALQVGSGVLYSTCITTNPDPARLPVNCDRPLTAAIQATLPHSVREVTAVTSDHVIARAADKQQLAQTTQAEVVDMEGFATVQQLTQWGLTVATLRVVSDDSQHDIPNLAPAVNPDGSLQPVALAIAMMKQPIAALQFIQGSMKSLKILQSLTTELFRDAIN